MADLRERQLAQQASAARRAAAMIVFARSLGRTLRRRLLLLLASRFHRWAAHTLALRLRFAAARRLLLALQRRRLRNAVRSWAWAAVLAREATAHRRERTNLEVAARLPRAELAALPGDAGFVMGTASDPTAGRDFTMVVAPDEADFAEAGTGYWCPTATTVAAVGPEPGPLVVELATAYLLDQVQLGTAAWWGDELVRVDATDPVLLTVTLGRGCGDTVAQTHPAGSRIWFYDGFAAFDATEYTDGETVQVKLLSNTGSAQLSPLLATAMAVTLDQRAARPYPPAGLQINGDPDPGTAIGDMVLTWRHRDRVLQADKLVDDSLASVGPEPGTTYTARYFLGGVLQDTQAGIVGTTTTYTPEGVGVWRIELESVRDGLTSWQMQVRELVVGAPLLSEPGDLITTESGQPILME